MWHPVHHTGCRIYNQHGLKPPKSNTRYLPVEFHLLARYRASNDQIYYLDNLVFRYGVEVKKHFCFFLGLNLVLNLLKGDPALIMKYINPIEAKLIDGASGIHIKFRLAGVMDLNPLLIYINTCFLIYFSN
jgi:hypothetical protein